MPSLALDESTHCWSKYMSRICCALVAFSGGLSSRARMKRGKRRPMPRPASMPGLPMPPAPLNRCWFVCVIRCRGGGSGVVVSSSSKERRRQSKQYKKTRHDCCYCCYCCCCCCCCCYCYCYCYYYYPPLCVEERERSAARTSQTLTGLKYTSGSRESPSWYMRGRAQPSG